MVFCKNNSSVQRILQRNISSYDENLITLSSENEYVTNNNNDVKINNDAPENNIATNVFNFGVVFSIKFEDEQAIFFERVLPKKINVQQAETNRKVKFGNNFIIHDEKVAGTEETDNDVKTDVTKSFQCSNCSENFILYSSLINHRKVKHAEKHSCDICLKSFSSLNNLMRHIATIHKKEEDTDYMTKCNQCLKIFRKDKFEYHSNVCKRKAEKSNETKICSVCEKAFSTMKSLLLHARTHSENYT